jgi:hypothetical protein
MRFFHFQSITHMLLYTKQNICTFTRSDSSVLIPTVAVTVDGMRERELFIFLVLLVGDVHLGYRKLKRIKNTGETQSV